MGSLKRLAFTAAWAVWLGALVNAPALAQICCSITSVPPSDPGHAVAPGTPVTLAATCLQNPTTYSWSTGATTQSIVVAPTIPTQYLFSGTNSAGVCSIAYFVNVTMNGTSPGGARVTGSFLVSGSGGGYLKVNFSCLGLPTCVGVYSGIAQDSGCSNTFAVGDTQASTASAPRLRNSASKMEMAVSHTCCCSPMMPLR